METRTVIGSVMVAGVTATLAFAACRTRSLVTEPTSASTVGGATTPTVSDTTSGAAASASSSGGNQDAGLTPAQKLAADAERASACSVPRATFLNQPGSGVVFNNAMTSVDAGFIDRTRGVLDALASHSAAFRCCFDSWAQTNPTQPGHLTLVVTLNADGTAEDARVDPARSNMSDPLTDACVALVAQSATYPASPTGKTTLVEYPFHVAIAP